MTERDRDELIEALAHTIVSRQGNPNRTRAEYVLAVIDELGWKLVRKDAP